MTMTATRFKPITVLTQSALGGNLANEPGIISIVGDTDIGANAAGDGSDISVYLNDQSTLLDHSLDYYAVPGGAATVVLAVKLPNISKTVDKQEIILAYDDPTPPSITPANVFPGMAGRWSCQQNPSGAGTVLDTMGGSNAGPNSGTPTQVTGLFGKAIQCVGSGTADGIGIPRTAALDFNGGGFPYALDFQVEFLVKTNNGIGLGNTFFWGQTDGSTKGIAIFDDSTFSAFGLKAFGSGGGKITLDKSLINNNAWHHVVINDQYRQFVSEVSNVYVDGVPIGSPGGGFAGGFTGDTTDDISMVYQAAGVAIQFQEFRRPTLITTPDQILWAATNQLNNASTISLGAETNLGGGGGGGTVLPVFSEHYKKLMR